MTTEMKVQEIMTLDAKIREEVDEDLVIDVWLTYGVPDGATYEDITEYLADDPELFNEWMRLGYSLLAGTYLA